MTWEEKEQSSKFPTKNPVQSGGSLFFFLTLYATV